MTFTISKEQKEPVMITETTSSSAQTATECACGRPVQQLVGASKASVHPAEIKNILVAVDFSDYSKTALDYSIFLAEKFGATLTLAHAVEPYVYPEDLAAGLSVEQVDARWLEKEKTKLEAIRQTIKKGIPTAVIVTMGTPWNRIVGMAKKGNADIIVLGTHGRTGIKHAIMGSTAEKVVQHAACPVMVIHNPAKAA